MSDWNLTHTIYTTSKRPRVWEFMSDMSNQVRMESAVEAIELDGPFESGTHGRTIMKEYTQEWMLEDVVQGQRFTITGKTEGQDFALSFAWKMEDEGEGTRLTQTISANGSDIKQFEEILTGMREHVPKRLAQLAEELDQMNE